jgi:hypothetical protein
VAFGLFTGPGEPPAQAAPSTFTIVGGGYGHGVGMSQYGAHSMALRGAGAGRIISFYYGGAQARPATLPATVRVELLQANRDPSTGGRLGRVLVRGVEVPGLGGSGRFSVSGVTSGGRTVKRTLSGHVTWSIKPESGGTSVFDLSRRRVFGPTRAGAGVVRQRGVAGPGDRGPQLRVAVGRGRARHRLAGRPLRHPDRAGVLLVVVGQVHLQQQPVGERPPALVPQPLRRPL